MVLRERIELSTSPLPRECSTTELPQRRWVEFDRGGDLDVFAGPRKRKVAQLSGRISGDALERGDG